MSKVIGLFPTPLLLKEKALDNQLVERLKRRALAGRKDSNAGTDLLSHTEMVDPDGDEVFRDVSAAVVDDIQKFGMLMFGDQLDWRVKEMWLNVLEHGGSQFMHTHANSFMSGIVYLTHQDASSRTLFQRQVGTGEFVFRHDGRDDMASDFTAERWVVPEVQPGDLVLYPSHLLHGVPPNQGQQRMTLALNAIPSRLKSFGYEIKFSR
ncbi:MAG: putative 2OG-Fe(II) oxygenase [Pseudomonadota bacterium]